MRSTQKCPKCEGQQFAVTKEFRQRTDQYPGNTVPLWAIAIPKRYAPQGEAPEESATLGRFESWICLACGYTEFYAYGLEGLHEVARFYPDRLRIVDARPPGQGPYR